MYRSPPTQAPEGKDDAPDTEVWLAIALVVIVSAIRVAAAIEAGDVRRRGHGGAADRPRADLRARSSFRAAARERRPIASKGTRSASSRSYEPSVVAITASRRSAGSSLRSSRHSSP